MEKVGKERTRETLVDDRIDENAGWEISIRVVAFRGVFWGVLGAMSGVAVGLRALTCWSDMPFLGRKLLGQKVAYVSFP